jgi:hypothetical protein
MNTSENPEEIKGAKKISLEAIQEARYELWAAADIYITQENCAAYSIADKALRTLEYTFTGVEPQIDDIFKFMPGFFRRHPNSGRKEGGDECKQL